MKTYLVAALWCFPFVACAQQPTVAPTTATRFSYQSDPVVLVDGDTQTYTLLATEPPSSKLPGQKIQLRIEGTGPRRNFTHALTINTGKFKTVSATEKIVADIVRRFLAGPVAAGQDFGQIGNVNLGGEMHFVAASADQLDYKIATPGKVDNLGHFSRVDVQTFLPILTANGGG